MRTQFCIYGEPRGKERPKFSTVCGHVTARTPENTVLYENLVKNDYTVRQGKQLRQGKKSYEYYLEYTPNDKPKQAAGE